MTEHQPATYTLTEQQLLDVYTAGAAASITHLMVRQTGAPLEATKRVVARYIIGPALEDPAVRETLLMAARVAAGAQAAPASLTS